MKPLPNTLLAALALVAACVLPSCTLPLDSFSEDPSLQHDLDHQSSAQSEAHYSYWNDTGGPGNLRVTIDLSEQTAYIFRGDKQVGRSRVATGIPGRRTPTGSYSITEKAREKRSTLYGKMLDANGYAVMSDADSRTDPVPEGGRFLGASMPYWMRLTSSGIGMHAGPIPRPGYPASHGCIRMPPAMARNLFTSAPSGTPVSIVP